LEDLDKFEEDKPDEKQQREAPRAGDCHSCQKTLGVDKAANKAQHMLMEKLENNISDLEQVVSSLNENANR